MSHLIFPIIDDAYHASMRTRVSFFTSLGMAVGVSLAAWLEFIPVPALPITLALATFVLGMTMATVAYHRVGPHSLPYRVLNYVESETLLAGLALTMAYSSVEAPLIWAFYIGMALMFGVSVGVTAVGLLAVALPPVVLAVAQYGVLTTDEWHMLIGGTLLAEMIHFYFGKERQEQVTQLEKHLRTDSELAFAKLQLDNERRLNVLDKNWLATLQQTAAGLYLVSEDQSISYVGTHDPFNLLADEAAEARRQLTPLIARALESAETVAGYGLTLPNARYADIRIVPLPPEETTQKARAAMLVQDATERVGLEAENKELLGKVMLSEKMASLGLLSAGVAHEINNPLTYISGNLEIIMAAPVAEELRGPLADVQSGFRQIESIVGDLKAFSFDPKEMPPKREDLREICRRTQRLVSTELRQSAQLELLLPEEPVEVLCHADRIQQVLLNLVINARQSLPPRPPTHNRIAISLRKQGASAVIEVKDNGVGIEKAALRQIFDPFYTTKAPGVGTGLGLSVSYQIAKRHGGQMEVRSIPGEGSVFTVHLPLATAETSSAWPLLVIDDEERNLELFSRALSGRFAVTQARSVAEALPLLTRPFRAVLSDIRLQDGTGFEIYHGAPPELQQRFLFLTALPLDAPELRGRPKGVSIIHKPVQLDPLREELLVIAAREYAWDHL